jgi:hypothetical protein
MDQAAISKAKKHWPEALASLLVVGLGQIVKKEGDKGLKLMLYFYLGLPTMIYVSLLINGYLFLLVLAFALLSGIILWIYNVWDALIASPANANRPPSPSSMERGKNSDKVGRKG